jgi:aminomethyltransferase
MTIPTPLFNTTALKTTPLNHVHRAAGARMVDFGGWDMPVHYGSQIEEHHAVRCDAGMFDVSHMCAIDIEGEQVRPFLRMLLANNIDKLQTAGKALYCCMLDQRGFVIDDLIVYFLNEQWFRLVVNAGTADKDLAWIKAQAATSGAALNIIERRSGSGALALIAVQGPNARAKVWQVLPETRAASEPLKPFNAAIIEPTAFGDVMVARTGYTGEDGFELAVPACHAAALWQALQTAGVRPAGLGARDTLRLEAGLHLYGQDMDQTVSPLDCGLSWTVDLAGAREFIGKTALLEHAASTQLLGLLLKDKGGILRAHQKVTLAASNGAAGGEAVGDAVGEITSGTFSPTLQLAIALARLPQGVAPGDTVFVAIRDKKLKATVVKLPFVRNGKILVA